MPKAVVTLHSPRDNEGSVDRLWLSQANARVQLEGICLGEPHYVVGTKINWKRRKTI